MLEQIAGKKPLACCIIVFAALLAFANSLGNGWNFDDTQLVTGNAAVHGLNMQNLKLLLTSVPNGLEYLPIRDLTYCLDYQLFGLSPFGYHLSNFLYYSVLCLLLYQLLLKLLQGKTASPALVAFLATVLFAVHPVHVESVAGIAQRKDLVSAIFLCLCLYFYLLHRDSTRSLYYVLSLLSLLLAMLSKSTVVIAPFLILLLDLFGKGEGESWKRAAARAMPFFLVAIIVSLVEYPIIRQAGIVQQSGLLSGLGYETRIYTAFKAVFYYLKLLLLPYPLYFLHPFHLSRTLLEPAVIFSLTGVALLVAAAYLCRKSRPVTAFSIFWLLICLLPVVGLVPTGTLVAERYLILPSVGFCLLIGNVVAMAVKSEHRQTGRAAAFSFMLVVAVFCGIDFARNRDWKDYLSLLRANIRHFPHDEKDRRLTDLEGRLYVLLGKELYATGRINEAFQALEKAIAINPLHITDRAIFAASNAYAAQKYEVARGCLDGIQVQSRDELFEINFLYAKIFEAEGNRERAVWYYRRALQSRLSLGLIIGIKPKELEQSIFRLSSAR